MELDTQQSWKVDTKRWSNSVGQIAGVTQQEFCNLLARRSRDAACLAVTPAFCVDLIVLYVFLECAFNSKVLQYCFVKISNVYFLQKVISKYKMIEHWNQCYNENLGTFHISCTYSLYGTPCFPWFIWLQCSSEHKLPWPQFVSCGNYFCFIYINIYKC